MKRKVANVSVSAAIGGLLVLAAVQTAFADEDLTKRVNDPNQWATQTGGYNSQHNSTLDQINKNNVKNVKAAWSFSTGVLHGHEGAPLVIGDMMYIHSAFPNNTFAVNLNDPGKIVWSHKPKQDASTKAVMCCDIVDRGVAYGAGQIVKKQADGHLLALDAKTGKVNWKVELLRS